ncbi:hypothetical protein ACFL5H_00020 [Candidatus Latescibacterota bacterium]
MVKIKLFLIIGFGIVMLEILIGSVSLGTGLLVQKYDREKAEETIAIISETDPNYYALLTDQSDPSHREEFTRIYTTKGNRTVVAYGIVLLVISVLTLIPLVPVYYIVTSQMKVGSEETETGEEIKKGEEIKTKEVKESKERESTPVAEPAAPEAG